MGRMPPAPVDSGFRRNDEEGHAGTTARHAANINATTPSHNTLILPILSNPAHPSSKGAPRFPEVRLCLRGCPPPLPLGGRGLG